MAVKNKGLGRGLGTLLGEVADLNRKAPSAAGETPEKGEVSVKIRLVEPNRSQPRKDFSEAELNELADSIRVHGVIQPLIVVKKGEHYEIVAGERRWRAAKLAGLKEVPVLIRDYTDAHAAEISLIENIQRKDLNPIEEAEAYRALIEEYQMTQETLSERVSKSRAGITNALRLLKLPKDVQAYLAAGTLSTGHAKVILGLDSAAAQSEIAKQAVENRLSVREVERLVASYGRKKKPVKPKKVTKNAVAYEEAAHALQQKLGTKVRIKRTGDNKGTIEIDFYSLEDFERISAHVN